MRKFLSIFVLVLLVGTVIVYSVSTDDSTNAIQKENEEEVMFTREILNEIITELNIKFSSSKSTEQSEKINEYAYRSVENDTCINSKTEPILHDLLSPEDIKALLGVPEYEKGNVLIYSQSHWLFTFKDNKLDKLASVSCNGDDAFYVKEMYEALNLEEVRVGIENKIQEEKEFKAKRDSILNSDKELSELVKMSSVDVLYLIGTPDKISENNMYPLCYYVTDECVVAFNFDQDKVMYCSRADVESKESKIIYRDVEDLYYRLSEYIKSIDNSN